MALTPEDVVNKRFQPTKFREGYDQDEVDDFLDEIVVELRRLNQENDELRKKLAEAGSSVPASSAAAPVVEKVPAPVKADKDEAREKAEAEAKAAETKKKDVQPAAPAAAAPAAPAAAVSTSAESAAGLLAMAQQMHDRHVADGQAQKDKIIAEAQIEASSLVNDAQEKSRKILGALEQQRSVLERKVEQLRGFERDYRSRLKAYIEGQLRDLDARGSVATPEVSEAN
ncbi:MULTISPECIES: DivIVA domain-containing protein [Arthrobacter]|uniref:DivIVA domain-containing protein n=1 Tax=Arthrobacter TaxID=1663 RepID=UPI001EEFF9E4|nr:MULTISPECIES: DivIVA domain-containing protein [Arthrobacter]MDP9987279.1 DivIVA domain-containing protein [Arthrobacter oryzae]UKA72762.1 DivIVA domain-containing protein [Arthrobacter sp. FW306-06-A]UKA76992.1 DivIVA domain-containing protein [Arthrobacter sp. FW306-07-I]